MVRFMGELASFPAVRAHMQRPSSLGGIGWISAAFRRQADDLRAGRTEAQAIMAMLDPADPAIGGLRSHLKAQPPSPECVIWLLFENRRLSASQAARAAAQSKNAAPRKFVADAWATRADQDQSQASFARMMVPLVKQRFGLIVTPDRIVRAWLPKK